MAVTIFLIAFSGALFCESRLRVKSQGLARKNNHFKTRVATKSECYRLPLSLPYRQSLCRIIKTMTFSGKFWWVNFLFAVSLSRQWHDILDFSNCPLSCVLHVTLANLGSSPSAFSGFVNVSQLAAYFTACYTVLKRPNKVETAVHGCNLAFSLDSIVSLPR